MSNENRADQEKIRKELEVVRAKSEGILHPSAVVAFAEDKATELHKRFDWNNASAGHQYRLWQARHLIRVVAETETADDVTPIPVYVSLSSDRKDGGYRSTREVFAEDDLRQTLLEDAKREMQHFKNKYRMLKELEKVFLAIEDVA